MNLKFLILFIALANTVQAGTPVVNDTYFIYLFLLFTIGILIGMPYLIKFIKIKIVRQKNLPLENKAE